MNSVRKIPSVIVRLFCLVCCTHAWANPDLTAIQTAFDELDAIEQAYLAVDPNTPNVPKAQLLARIKWPSKIPSPQEALKVVARTIVALPPVVAGPTCFPLPTPSKDILVWVLPKDTVAAINELLPGTIPKPASSEQPLISMATVRPIIERVHTVVRNTIAVQVPSLVTRTPYVHLLPLAEDLSKAHLENRATIVGRVLQSVIPPEFSVEFFGLSKFSAQSIGRFSKPELTENPDPIEISFGIYSGDPVYYVNGIDTTSGYARDNAKLLSEHLQRRVLLIYNHSTGIAGDLLEAIYDRAWPSTYSFIGVGGIRRQENRTTRRITAMLIKNRGPISIVTHSQGCLQMRNALLTAHVLLEDKTIVSRVRWVACGLPMRDEEISPKPPDYKPVTHSDDMVATFVGFRTTGHISKKDAAGHSFRNYIADIPRNAFW